MISREGKMTKVYIKQFSDSSATLDSVGGKGASLVKLASRGLPVPDGFNVATPAYLQFISANNLMSVINDELAVVDLNQPSTLEEASRKIREKFYVGQIPPLVANAILESYAALPGSNPAVAVRSSATAEDLPEASFAGQQESYLNVSGPNDLLDAVKKCWASLWTGRAIGYRSRREISPDQVALAVVVQLLVPAEAAGILFTANPLNGRRDQAVINASWGLGEAVVSGAVTPDTITIDKLNRQILGREIADKQVMTVRINGGTREVPVAENMRRVPVLGDQAALELTDLGIEIERLYGMPMDIEWALLDGEFAIVQARPVTALPEVVVEWAPPNPKGTYMRTSVTDLMPEPLSPLFKTLWIPTQIEQMQPLGKLMTSSEPVLVEDYLTTINNYAYVNAAMPMKSMWWYLTGLLPAYPRLLRKLVPLWREELHPQYQAFVASKRDLAPAQMTTSELWREVQALVEAAAYYVCGLMFATMGASAGSEGLLSGAYNRLAKQNGDPDASALLMGWDNIPVRAEKSLYDIAMWVAQDEDLAEYMLNTPSENLAAQLESPDSAPPQLFPEFASRFQEHLEQFGHIIFQLDFAEPLPLDHPEIMLQNIKMYLRGEGRNPHERQEASMQKRIQTTETMLKRLKGIKLWAFRIALNWGQSMAEVREDALAEIGLAYPKLRKLLYELGNRLVEEGAIQQPDDIFWLEKQEIDLCVADLERNQSIKNLSRQVDRRRAFHKQVENITPPPMMPMKERVMGIKSEAFIAHTEDAQEGNVLKGVATSTGKVTAPARVLHGPEDFDLMQPGDILVAGTTTPAWTPLFAMASAVVTDIGGPLSHGSIVAREYGIPAVMGTGIATKRILNGEMITVDGSAGTVTLESDLHSEAALST
jgi:phosphohistidine swiveling domain-containing protein